MESYFTNMDFPEIAGVPFPFQKATFWGLTGRVFGRENNLTRAHINFQGRMLLGSVKFMIPTQKKRSRFYANLLFFWGNFDRRLDSNPPLPRDGLNAVAIFSWKMDKNHGTSLQLTLIDGWVSAFQCSNNLLDSFFIGMLDLWWILDGFSYFQHANPIKFHRPEIQSFKQNEAYQYCFETNIYSKI